MYRTDPIRLSATQVDPDGNQTLTSLMSIMQDCSQLWLESEPETADWFETDGVTMMISFRQMDVGRFPKFGERLYAQTRIYGAKKFFAYRNTVIYDEEDRPVAWCYGIGVFVSNETGHPVRIADRMIDSLTYDPEFPMEYCSHKVRPPKGGMTDVPPFAVRNSDIDINNHVNNVQYLRMALDLLPLSERFTRVRVEYKQAAKLGDTIAPKLHRNEDGTVAVVLASAADGAVFAALELSNPDLKVPAGL